MARPSQLACALLTLCVMQCSRSRWRRRALCSVTPAPVRARARRNAPAGQAHERQRTRQGARRQSHLANCELAWLQWLVALPSPVCVGPRLMFGSNCVPKLGPLVNPVSHVCLMAPHKGPSLFSVGHYFIVTSPGGGTFSPSLARWTPPCSQVRVCSRVGGAPLAVSSAAAGLHAG